MNEWFNYCLDFAINHQFLFYAILFLGSMFETIIGISFFVYGEIFFLTGAILAGMGILNIWIVIAVLYGGGILGDNISYFLGRVYGIDLYKKLGKNKILSKIINENNFKKGSRFFCKYGAVSVFLGRLLGPLSWITPFIAGTYKLNYKKFLPYDIAGVVIGIGQFIIAGYFFGKNFDYFLKIFETYIIIIVFLLVMGYFLYLYLKKIKVIKKIRELFNEDKKILVKYIVTHSALIISALILIYTAFLFYAFFVNIQLEKNICKNFYTISYLSKVKSCKDLGTYYIDNPKNIIQPVNIILKTNLNLKQILDDNWVKNDIFSQNHISFLEYIKSLKDKIPPVSSLYFIGIPQNYAYQYKSNSLSKREHIRFWEFDDNKFHKKIYYATISYDNGYKFIFYRYFFTPIHKIDKNIDKSRNFFYKYLLTRKNLKVKCKFIQTKCKIKELKGDNEPAEEQKFYTDGTILECVIKAKK